MTAVSSDFKRKFTVSATDVETGVYETFNNDNITFDDMPHAAMASGSIPVVFGPQYFHDMYLMDGGTVWGVNAQSAIEQCLAIVEDQSDIYLDVMLCDYHEAPEAPDKTNTVHNYWRAKDIHDLYHNNHDVSQQEAPYPDVNYRYFFQDNDDCDIDSLLDFRNSTTWCL